MVDAAIDSSSRQTMIARLNSNGTTIQRIYADPATHRMKASDGTTGSDNGGTLSATDSNGRAAMNAVSNANGVTITALYADSSGNLLIKTT